MTTFNTFTNPISAPSLKIGDTVVVAVKEAETPVTTINLCKIDDTYTPYTLQLTTITETDGGYCYVRMQDDLGELIRIGDDDIKIDVIKNYPAFVIRPVVETFEIDAHVIDSSTTSYTDSNSVTYFIMRNGENITVIMSTTKALTSSKNIIVTLDSTFSVTITLNTVEEKFINVSTDEGKAIISSSAPTFSSNTDFGYIRVKNDITVCDGTFNNKVSYTLDENNIDTVAHLHIDDTISGPFKWYKFSPRIDETMGSYNQFGIYNTSQQNVTSSMITNTYNPVFEIEFDNSTATTIERYLIMIVNEKEYKMQITANVTDDGTISITHGYSMHLNYDETYYGWEYVYTLPFNFYVKDKYIYIQFKNDVLYDKIGVKLMNYSGEETIYSRVIYNKTPISDCVYMDNNVVKAKSIFVSGTPIENLMMAFYAADVVDNLLEPGHHYAFMVDKNVHTYDVTHLYMENRPNLWNTDMANFSNAIFWYYDTEHRLRKIDYGSNYYIARYENSLELTVNYGETSPLNLHIGFSSLGFLYNLDDPRYVFGYQQSTIYVADAHLRLYTLDHAKVLVWSYYVDPTTSTPDDPSIFTSMHGASSTTTSSFIANHDAENRSITNVSIYKQSATEPSVAYDSIQSFKCYNKLNDDLVLQNIISDVTSYITYEHSDSINVLGVMYANTKKWIINDDVADSYDKVEVIDANDNIISEFVNDRSKADFGKISATMVDVNNILTNEIDVKHVYAEDTHTDIFTANGISFKPYKYSVTPAITFNNDYFIFEFDSTASTFTFGFNTNADFSTTTTDELRINVWSMFYLGNSGSPGLDLQAIYNKSSNQYRAGRYNSESTTPISEHQTFNYNGVEGYWYTSDDCSKIIVYHPNYTFHITVESLSSDINSIKPIAALSTTPSSSINVNFNAEFVQGNISIGEENISYASKRISISTDDTNSTIFKTPMMQTSAFQLASTPITATKLNTDDPDSLNVYQLSRNGHKHVINDVEGLEDTLEDVSHKGHGHAISDVNDLQSTINGKANTSHTHAISEITDYAPYDDTELRTLINDINITPSQPFNTYTGAPVEHEYYNISADEGGFTIHIYSFESDLISIYFDDVLIYTWKLSTGFNKKNNLYEDNITFHTERDLRWNSSTPSYNVRVMIKYLDEIIYNDTLSRTFDLNVSPTCKDMIDIFYPIGSVYTSFTNIHPRFRFPGTTWAPIVDRFLYASAGGSGQLGGHKKILTENLPAHNHQFGAYLWNWYMSNPTQLMVASVDGKAGPAVAESYSEGGTGGIGTAIKGRSEENNYTNNTGSGTDYMPPYITVYMWSRTG